MKARTNTHDAVLVNTHAQTQMICACVLGAWCALSVYVVCIKHQGLGWSEGEIATTRVEVFDVPPGAECEPTAAVVCWAGGGGSRVLSLRKTMINDLTGEAPRGVSRDGLRRTNATPSSLTPVANNCDISDTAR